MQRCRWVSLSTASS